jgi:hypothetical protein
MCYQDKTANPPVCTCLCDTGSSPSRPASPQGCVDRTSGSAPFLDFKDRDRAALPGYTTRPDRPGLSLPCRSQPLGAMELPRSDAYGTQGGARSWEGGARWVPGTWSACRSVRGGGGGGRTGGGGAGESNKCGPARAGNPGRVCTPACARPGRPFYCPHGPSRPLARGQVDPAPCVWLFSACTGFSPLFLTSLCGNAGLRVQRQEAR